MNLIRCFCMSLTGVACRAVLTWNTLDSDARFDFLIEDISASYSQSCVPDVPAVVAGGRGGSRRDGRRYMAVRPAVVGGPAIGALCYRLIMVTGKPEVSDPKEAALDTDGDTRMGFVRCVVFQ